MKHVYVMAILLLTSCTHGARIQYDYLDVRDECRDFSEDNFAPYVGQYYSASGGLTVRDKNAILAKLFADCMYQKGWTVATPGKGNSAPQRQPSSPQPSSMSQPAMQQPPAQQPAPPIRYIPAEPPRPATNMPIPATRQRIN